MGEMRCLGGETDTWSMTLVLWLSIIISITDDRESWVKRERQTPPCFINWRLDSDDSCLVQG